jgi:hypothetical protein
MARHNGEDVLQRVRDHAGTDAFAPMGDALVGLMHEKPFRAITVGNVLKRAEVGALDFLFALS